MIASLNHSSSASSLGSALMSGATFTVRPSRQPTEEHGRVLLLIDAQANAAPLDRVLLAGGASPFMPSGLFWIVLRRSWASFAPASTPFQSGLLPRSCLRCCPSALRAARHRERERIKSDVGLAEQGKRIGRPTISRRLRERIAERIAAARRPLASPRIYPDRR